MSESPIQPGIASSISDAGTRRLDRIVGVGLSPFLITEGEGAVWVVNIEDGTVSRIDPPQAGSWRPSPSGRAREASPSRGGVWVDVHPG